MRATHPILLAPWLQPWHAHHRFVATYLSILMRNNGRYIGNLLETRLLQQVAASFVGQGPGTTVATGLLKQ